MEEINTNPDMANTSQEPSTNSSAPGPVTATPGDSIDMTNPQYQGFWIRFVAALLDGLIVSLPVGIIQSGLVWATGIDSLRYLISLAMVIFIIYMEGIQGGTPGKLIMGMRIVNEQGQYIGIPSAILRYIGKILSALILLIGYFMIGWDPKKQGLHDKIAKSYVVKK